MAKTILCRCEDVTLRDVEHAIELGYYDIEEIKRYTGFGTGPCQGKECMWAVACVLGERAGIQVPPFTSRAPLVPTALKYFAHDGSVPATDATPDQPPGDDVEHGP